MGFYIRYETHQDGPYDLVSMIRKIRKGTLSPDALVMEENEPKAQPARQHPELNSFFRELEEDYVNEEALDVIESLSFGKALHYGWDFFQHNLLSGLIAALTLFAISVSTMIIMLITNGALLPATLLIGMMAAFFFCGFIYLMQQLHRRMAFSLTSLFEYYLHHGLNILLFSAVFSVMILTGLLLFIVPGLILFSRLIFAPILVVDQNYHFWHAIEESNRVIKQNDPKLYQIILALIGLNVAAGLLVLPLVITLPITYCVILEIYNRFEFH